MKPHPSDEFSDWSESFDDMDGGVWEEHFALFEPADEGRDGELTSYAYLARAVRALAPSGGSVALHRSLGELKAHLHRSKCAIRSIVVRRPPAGTRR